MIILIQAITVIYALFLSMLNEVPVIKMRDFGASLNEEKIFHRSNAMVKIIYSIVVPVSFYGFSVKPILLFFALLFIQWLVFDIALNLLIGKPWDYIGETAKDDKMLRKLFGKPGIVKAIFCVVVISVLNVFIK